MLFCNTVHASEICGHFYLAFTGDPCCDGDGDPCMVLLGALRIKNKDGNTRTNTELNLINKF